MYLSEEAITERMKKGAYCSFSVMHKCKNEKSIDKA